MNSLNIVLVRSIYPRNIGAVARAMSNLGALQLILVDPKCELNQEAREGAAGAQEKLATSKIYSSVDELHQNEKGLFIALTRRSGRRRQVQPLDLQVQKIETNTPIYLMLGPEDHGLSDDDMRLCHWLCELPTFGDFASYNLAQAALLAMYIVKDKIQSLNFIHEEEIPAPLPEKALKAWVESSGFKLDHMKVNAFTILRRMILKSAPTEKEASVLNAILQQNIRNQSDKAETNVSF